VRFAGLRTVAFDGLNSVKIPDTARNRAWAGKIRHRLGLAGYPALRLMALAETGARGLLGATIGSRAERDETGLARRLLPLLRPGMLVLLDRAFDSAAFLAEIVATGAAPLARAKSTRTPPVLQHLPDGSYLSRLDGLDVRIIEAEVAMTGPDGTRIADSYRLITTLLDPRRYPADALTRLYHERWEIESAYLALRHTLLGGRVLRSGDRPGVEQEVWALLTLYQLLRMAMVTAVETRPGTDPDRASFTTALEAARDQLTAAAGICPGGAADLTGVIGRAVLATLLPARRPLFSARKVKCATSRYLNHGDQRPAPSPRSTSPCAPRRWTPATASAGPTAAGHLPCWARTGPPAATRSPPPSPASRHGTGPATTWPSCSASNPATCSTSSANGAGSGSSPAPAPAPTGSTRREPGHPRHPPPTLNYAALACDGPAGPPLTRWPRLGQSGARKLAVRWPRCA